MHLNLDFFLNGPRIMNSVFSTESRPISSSLLYSILLCGIHLSGSPALQARENEFLSRAVRSVTPIQPHQVTQNIQAEVLLAQYFLRQGRFLEAMHRINAAASLAIGCGLHRLPSDHTPTSAFALPSTRDAVEQGERVNAFWMIMALHKIFGVIMQWPSSVSGLLDEQIDVPWPLEMEVYESGIVPINPQRQFTMQAFFDDPRDSEAANSSLAQHAKAAALFKRASHIGGNRPNLADPEEYAQFMLFEHGLNQVIQALPSFDNVQGSIDVIRQRLVNFTLCQVAIIQFHSALDHPASIHKCLSAARAVVEANQRIPNMHIWEYIDSTMGTLWVAVCQIIIRAIATIKNPRGSTPAWTASVSNGDYPSLKSALGNMTSTMMMFSPRCLLIGKFRLCQLYVFRRLTRFLDADYQLNRVQESYRALCG
ncbi:hypothetical protein B0H14DRAFT_3852185 [Mycena olivaceomarginata]|nr:hypothetical protein B0H14DRAFT_3852185 [Mycena olivaceomarginata]